MQPTEETFTFLPLNTILIYSLQPRILILENYIKTGIYEASRKEFVIMCVNERFPNMSPIMCLYDKL
jgi:hypothetical protein